MSVDSLECDVCTINHPANEHTCHVSSFNCGGAAVSPIISTNPPHTDSFPCGFFDSDDICFDTLIQRAYGSTLVQPDGGGSESTWCSWWKQVIYHSGNHYVLPGRSTGRQYVDVLANEVNYLACGTYPSERILVFSSVILQHDRMVRKGADVCRLLGKCLCLWQQENFDLLIQEANRCDQVLRQTRHSVVDDESVIHVFTKLMLLGKVKAAVRWATDRMRGVVLSPLDLINGSDATTVMDVLRQKHPAPCPPTPSSLLKCDPLPQLEDVEITGSHILYSAHKVQGGAGPGGCDSCHWHDALLRYGAHSARL